MTDIKVIAVDIHGTILPEHNRVHDIASVDYYNIVQAKMKKFQEYLSKNEIKFIVVTGGGIPHAFEIPLKIGIEPHAYYCAQGAIYSLDSGESWRVSPWIRKTLRADLKHYVDEIKVVYNNLNIKVKNLTIFDFIVFVEYEELITKEVHELIKKVSPNYKVYIVHDKEHMITFKENDKNQAIEHYSKTMNIPLNQILFYGNSTNDLEALTSKKYKTLVSKNYVHFPHVDSTFKEQILDKNCIIGKENLVLGLFDYLNLQL
jgi:hydroxymethylpyrimidine pyrophosphatase-like HAD family hydrolase